MCDRHGREVGGGEVAILIDTIFKVIIIKKNSMMSFTETKQNACSDMQDIVPEITGVVMDILKDKD